MSSRLGFVYSEKPVEPDLLQHGLLLFNRGHFFDAHEALEDVWRETPRHSHRRRHLQGLVQLAVAFHHQSTGNLVGARSVLERALRNLTSAEESFPELDIEGLRACLSPWREYLEQARQKPEGLSPPESPRVQVRPLTR